MDPAEEEESSPLHPETRYEEELEGPPPPDDKADLSFEEHFQSGDTVLIRSKDELYIILQLFSPTHDCIAPLTVSEIADHYAVVVDIIQNPDPHLNLGNFAVLLLEDSGQDIVLPLNAFRYVRMEVKEVEDEEEVHILPNGSMKTSPQMNEGLLMVQNIAAEYIQQAYR